MDSQENSGIVETGNFPLMEMPIMAQLTIHINNLILTYGKDVIQDFKIQLTQNENVGGLTIEQLINYYGQDTLKQYFTLIYGWSFDQKAG